jgi:MurNAc alpha-1-phosphate uridylyltransferase
MRAMILAAGRGERLRPITDDIPKALVEVGGKSVLEWHLERVSEAGIRQVVINLGWHGEQIVERLGSGERYGIEIAYSDEGEGILETGGGIYKALPLLGDDPFLVINSDIFTDMPVPDVQLREDHLGHLVTVPTPAYLDHGDFNIEDGLVRRTENPRYTYAGFAIYRPELFAQCEAGRFSVVPLMFAAADAGRLSGSVYAGRWADIGTPERLAALQMQVEEEAQAQG